MESGKCKFCGAKLTNKKAQFCSQECLKTYLFKKKQENGTDDQRKHRKTIAEINRKARAAGLTYGQYVARHE